MTRPITTVKKEIRTLGLDTCNPKRIVGVVVRGGLYLDGIISIPSSSSSEAQGVARQIRESRYFPELRSIMLHDPKNRLDPRTVQRTTSLPVIQVSRVNPPNGRGYRLFQAKRGRLWVRTRLTASIIQQMLSVTWTSDQLPEPARVAHLLALVS